ncbi:hypothetical protein [Laribacter hongkongensis]|uniref:hypothetical protein n=1 Tax=Laribacter hongkongensis TaxID=168471 RepID=UPI001EFDF65B|nr:hypothetical protein [Laribacter hongkongensis]MCG9076210.1 hypothetical protein [Laribacter hongkongensis]
MNKPCFDEKISEDIASKVLEELAAIKPCLGSMAYVTGCIPVVHLGKLIYHDFYKRKLDGCDQSIIENYKKRLISLAQKINSKGMEYFRPEMFMATVELDDNGKFTGIAGLCHFEKNALSIAQRSSNTDGSGSVSLMLFHARNGTKGVAISPPDVFQNDDEKYRYQQLTFMAVAILCKKYKQEVNDLEDENIKQYFEYCCRYVDSRADMLLSIFN